MYYVIFAEDHPNSLEKRLAVRAQHLARLQALDSEGRLLTAGPNPAVDDEKPGEAGFTGSTVIAQFDSLDAAKAWAAPGVAESSASFLLRLCLSPRTKRVFGPPPLLDQEPGLLVSAALGLGSGSLFGFRCHEQGHRHFRSASSP